jgi:hypothetical protein
MIYHWQHEWRDFCRQHRSWLERHAPDGEVIYRLPTSIVAALAGPLLHGRPILSPADQHAEEAFDAVCGRFNAEGVYRGQPVVYAHLRPPVPPPTQEQYLACGIDGDVIGMVTAGVQRCHELQARNKGYIGRLVTDPTFRSARDALRASWQQQPQAERPGFPLRRAITGVPIYEAVPASPAQTDLQDQLAAFLDRYGLLGMATWELPDPAGPLLDGFIWGRQAPHLLAGRSVQIAVPAHFYFPGSDDLHGLVQDLQRQQTQAAGLDPSCIGPRSAESYAHLLEIDHFQRVADQRYGQRPRAKGYVNRLRDALADYLGIGLEHFRTLHRALTGYLRGKPHRAHRPR